MSSRNSNLAKTLAQVEPLQYHRALGQKKLGPSGTVNTSVWPQLLQTKSELISTPGSDSSSTLRKANESLAGIC